MNIKGFNSQVHTENAIMKALESNRFPHAAIIVGGTKEERSLLAGKIAATLLCADKETKPCGECSHCRKYLSGGHSDIIIRNPSKTKSGNLIQSVDDVRDIREKAYVIPNEADKKIFIINDSELMNVQAQNAFLKILEEPPEFTVFILLSSTKSVFLPTIISRATVYSLGEANEFSSEFPLEKMVSSAEGMVLATADDNDFELVKAAAVFEKNPKLLEACLPIMGEMFASALRIKFSSEENSQYECSKIAAQKMSKAALLNSIEGINSISNAINMNANQNLTLTRLCTLLR